MFCKWCGANVKKGFGKCSRCGRELPALSDCGGFFDLVPDAKNIISSGRIIEDDGGKKDDLCKQEANKSNKSNKSNKLLIAFFCLAVVVIVALGSVSMFKVLRPSADLFEEKNVVICADFENKDHVISLRASATADNIPVAINKAVFDKGEESIVANMSFDIADNEECLVFEVTETDVENKQGYKVVSARFEVDESVFAESKGDSEYSWSYRILGDSEWQALDETIFSPSQDGKTISYEVAATEKLCKNGEAVELQLTYGRSNEKGGSLKVVISGVLIAEKTAQ